MPTLLTVTFSKEFTLTVVANSEEELEAALKRHKYDVDDWDDMAHDGWEHQIIDEIIPVLEEDSGPISKEVNQLDGIPVGISSGAAIWAASP